MSTQNSHKRKLDYLVLATGIIFFLALAGGSVREYRRYRQGLAMVKKTESEVIQLEARRNRLQEQLDEATTPEFIEKQLRDKFGVGIGDEVTPEPTKEPELIDLRLPSPSPSKYYWGEWLDLMR